MTSSCGNLDVGETVCQSWKDALAIAMLPLASALPSRTSFSTAIALNQDNAMPPSRNLDVGETVCQSWKVALAIAIAATSISTAIAPNRTV